MIDAYEIGIQLALQDGVSAGLEAIGRDLAEVDRAIAATTVGLQGFTLAAQAASREAAAVGGLRVGAVTRRAAEVAEASSETVSPPRAAPASPSEGRVTKAVPSVLPISSVPESSPAPVAPTNAAAPDASVPEKAMPESPAAAVEQRRPSSAAAVTIRQQVSVAEFGTGSTTALTEPVSATPSASPARSADVGSASTVVPIAFPRKEFASPTRAEVAEPVVTASVSEAVPGLGSAAPAGPTAPAAGDYRHATAEQPVGRADSAAWVGSPGRARAPSQMAGAERAAAPQPQAREGGEGMSGTVMLDGRTIGSWMSDQMAREASKPPGGTTFFDPRQSPAWNASGAL